MNFSRRRFVRTVVVGGAAGLCAPASAFLPDRPRGGGAPAGPAWELHPVSERFRACHALRDGEAPPLPKPSLRADVVIVGGGPSGLVAAYRLRDREILLLEKEPEVGGNARADRWRGIPYAAGAIVTYARSPAMELYDELGLRPEKVPESFSRAFFVGDRLIEGDIWGGGLDRLYPPGAARSIRRAKKEILSLDAEGAKRKLDRMRLSDLLRPYRPEVKEWFDRLLAWFTGTTDDYSAYAGVHLARSQMGAGLGVLYPEGTSEGGAYSFPGGLSRAALALRAAVEGAGEGRILTGATAYRIEQDADGVTVAFLDADGPVAVGARAAIVAAPKFLCRHLVAGLPPEQADAMGRMRYAPFLVGAVAADDPISPGIDVARTLDAPIANLRNVSREPGRQLFRCEIPLPAHRRPALQEDRYLHALGEEIATYLERLFPGALDKVDQIRIWRRGHNWYLPVPGMLTGFQPLAARPFGRVLFANADSVGPISEFGWALVAADRAVEETRALLGDDARRGRVPGGWA